MDLLVWIILGIIYLVFQALAASKKKKPTRSQGTTAPFPVPDDASRDARSQEVTLDDALREIRQALGMEAPAPTAPPPTKPRQPSLPPSPPKPPASRRPLDHHQPELIDSVPKVAWGSEFKPQEKHYSDDEFEALPRGITRFEDPHYAASKRVRPPRQTTKADTPRPAHSQRLLNTLRDPAAAREAFLIHEILGPPRAFRRR